MTAACRVRVVVLSTLLLLLLLLGAVLAVLQVLLCHAVYAGVVV
jgi:hypothetical protein